jgi:type VI protein secretion system component VasF
MATSSMPNPQASAPQQGASPAANPLQEILAKVLMVIRQLGRQNTTIQPELNAATQSLVSAIQKVSQSSGPAQQAPVPTQQ